MSIPSVTFLGAASSSLRPSLWTSARLSCRARGSLQVPAAFLAHPKSRRYQVRYPACQLRYRYHSHVLQYPVVLDTSNSFSHSRYILIELDAINPSVSSAFMSERVVMYSVPPVITRLSSAARVLGTVLISPSLLYFSYFGGICPETSTHTLTGSSIITQVVKMQCRFDTDESC